MLGIQQKLLIEAFDSDAVAATPKAFRHCGVLSTTHTVEWSDGASSGVVEIETAPSEVYGGTWASVGTITNSGTGPRVDVLYVPGSYPAFRHRISTPVTDGTVTTKIAGSL